MPNSNEAASGRAPLSFLPAPLRGSVSLLLLALNTVICAAVLLPLSVIKLVLPFDGVRRRVDPMLNWIAERWIENNGLWMALAQKIDFDVRGVEKLQRRGWYLVEANHQSWVDIFVLQKVFNRRIPLLKFFLKRQLIWVPLIGIAWWALDFPFMRRRSEEYLKKHPEKRGQDLATIRKACEKFSLIPTSVMNFLEGTRFTPEKHGTDSMYRHLLSPKAGGIALALNAMGERFQSLLDVTLLYPGGVPTFFQFLSGKMKRVIVTVREMPIPAWLLNGDYQSDPDYRAKIQQWIHELWREKDELLERLISENMPAGATAE